MGTKMWTRGEVIWGTNNNMIIIACSILTCMLVEFKFILVPLTLAFFITFLLVPIMNLFELRPFPCKGKQCCSPKEFAAREESPDGTMTTCFDLFTALKVPHGLSVILTLAVFFGAVGGSFAVRPTAARSRARFPRALPALATVASADHVADADGIVRWLGRRSRRSWTTPPSRPRWRSWRRTTTTS